MGGLVSPITWTHHLYWFIPAVVVLVDAALDADRTTAAGARRRRGLLALAVGTGVVIVYGVVTFQDWGAGPVRTDDPLDFLARNAYVLLSLLLLAVLPISRRSVPAPG